MGRQHAEYLTVAIAIQIIQQYMTIHFGDINKGS